MPAAVRGFFPWPCTSGSVRDVSCARSIAVIEVTRDLLDSLPEAVRSRTASSNLKNGSVCSNPRESVRTANCGEPREDLSSIEKEVTKVSPQRLHHQFLFEVHQWDQRLRTLGWDGITTNRRQVAVVSWTADAQPSTNWMIAISVCRIFLKCDEVKIVPPAFSFLEKLHDLFALCE